MSGIPSTNPSLEYIPLDPKQSFRWYTHDYPSEVGRWNYHPEFEIHLITASSGKLFVGDYIGNFKPGNFVMLGPNLPHHWASDPGREDEVIKDRDIVLQFSGAIVSGAITEILPEFMELQGLLDASARGIEFSRRDFPLAEKLLVEIGNARGLDAFTRFIDLLRYLASKKSWSLLSSEEYYPKPSEVSSGNFQPVIDYVLMNISEEIRMSEAARIMGMSEPNFSKFFKRNTSMTFVDYVRKLKILRACKLLLESDMNITSVCYESGYRNISNFNRHFRKEKGITPSEYRRSAWSQLASDDN